MDLYEFTLSVENNLDSAVVSLRFSFQFIVTHLCDLFHFHIKTHIIHKNSYEFEFRRVNEKKDNIFA